MSTTIRTDSHRPSAIVPDNYEFVACEHIKTEGDPGLCEYQNEQREVIKAHMASTGGTYSRHEHGGNCHVCGSVNLIYSILFYHEPSNTYIRVGEDCADKLDMGGTAEMNRFRAAMHDALKAKAGKAKAQAILAKADLSRAWDIAQAYKPVDLYENPKVGRDNQEAIIADIVGKIVQYGNVSDKQLAFVGKLIERIDNRPVIAAQRAAEAALAADCPTGRIVVTGTVLSTRVQDTDFGIVTKMLVRADSGFKVWCTVPSASEVNKGDKITFTVSVEPSRDDPKFGFGKRPAKLTNLTAEAQQVFATCPHGDDGANCAACAAEAAPAVKHWYQDCKSPYLSCEFCTTDRNLVGTPAVS